MHALHSVSQPFINDFIYVDFATEKGKNAAKSNQEK